MKRIIRGAITIVLVAIIAFSAVQIATIMYESHRARQLQQELIDIMTQSAAE